MRRTCKDGDSIVDYSIDWSETTTTIAASTWTPDEGITVVSNDFTDTTTTVRVSGGTEWQEYAILNHITTSDGEEFDETVYFLIVER